MASATSIATHALLWWSTAESIMDLTPTGFDFSIARGVSGGQQVGEGYGSATGGIFHALLWFSTPDSLVDLHPVGFLSSNAYGVSGGQQVGWGFHPSGGKHALLWSGSAEAVVDLNPSIPGIYSEAFDVSDGQQVGRCWGIYGNSWGHTNRHAYLWSGTAESAVDLHPPIGFASSNALRISGGQQVGYGSYPGWHALLWSGTPDSVVDLNPNGIDRSEAWGVAGGMQVGYGRGSATGGESHALLWSGTADSVVDLHSYLTADYNYSQAWDIDSSGVIVGEARSYYALHAVMWIPMIYVEIDIKPGSYPNSISLGNNGVIPVAILSSWEFDATTVDPGTIELAGAGVELRGKSSKAMAHQEDANGDGLIDLVVQITTENLEPGYFQDGYATLTGKTYDGTAIEGTDEISIVPQ